MVENPTFNGPSTHTRREMFSMLAVGAVGGALGVSTTLPTEAAAQEEVVLPEQFFDARPVIAADLTCSLLPEVGPMPTYLRSTTPSTATSTIVDCYGYLKDTRRGEALFYGARRVENFVRFSEHLSYTGAGGWRMLNDLIVQAVADSRRPGSTGEQTVWKIQRAPVATSVLRTVLRRGGRAPGLDLLLPIPHVAAVNMRRAPNSPLTTAEIRVYVGGSEPLAAQVVELTSEMQTFGLSFTPIAPKRITGLSQSSDRLVVTVPSHGLTMGQQVRLSGTIPRTYDLEGSVIEVFGLDTFALSMSDDPGDPPTTFGEMQPVLVFGLSPGSFAETTAGAIEAEFPYVSDTAGYTEGAVPEYVPCDRAPQNRYWYGAAVDGVRYSNREPHLRLRNGIITSLGAAKALDTCRGIATFAAGANLLPREFAEDFTTWGGEGILVDVGLDVSPLGTMEACRINDSAVVGPHYVELPHGVITSENTSDNGIGSLACYLATPGGRVGATWAWLGMVDRAGNEQFAFVNLATGEAGVRTDGFRAVSVEVIKPVGGGLNYLRLMVTATMGSGSNDPRIRLGLSDADGAVSYPASGLRYLIAWGMSFVGGTLARPIAQPYARNSFGETSIAPGAAIFFETRGILGQQNVSAYSAYTPYYDSQQPDKVDWGATLYFRCESPQQIAGATTQSPTVMDFDRFGIVIRPSNSNGGTLSCCRFGGHEVRLA